VHRSGICVDGQLDYDTCFLYYFPTTSLQRTLRGLLAWYSKSLKVYIHPCAGSHVTVTCNSVALSRPQGESLKGDQAPH